MNNSIDEPSETNAVFWAKRDKSLVSRFAQHAAFASLGLLSAYAGYRDLVFLLRKLTCVSSGESFGGELKNFKISPKLALQVPPARMPSLSVTAVLGEWLY